MIVSFPSKGVFKQRPEPLVLGGSRGHSCPGSVHWVTSGHRVSRSPWSLPEAQWELLAEADWVLAPRFPPTPDPAASPQLGERWDSGQQKLLHEAECPAHGAVGAEQCRNGWHGAAGRRASPPVHPALGPAVQVGWGSEEEEEETHAASD